MTSFGMVIEGMLVERGDVERLVTIQRELVDEIPNRVERATLALTFGTRWVSRHQNVDTGTKLLEESLSLDPSSEGAFHYLRDVFRAVGAVTRELRG